MTTATTSQTNLATVGAIYEAFGRGDVPAILDRLAPDVAWDAPEVTDAAQDAGVPWLAPRRTPGEVAGFFTVLAEQLTFNDFQVLDLIASGDRVAAEIRLDVTSKASGERIVSDEVHLWTFDDHGRVIVFRHYVDTAKHMAAAGVG